MRSPSIRRLALSLCLLSLIAAVASVRVGAQSSTAPRIATVGIVDGVMTITGQNFGQAASGMIGEVRLAITSSSDTQIIASLPALAPAIYALKVSRDGVDTPETTALGAVTIE